MGLLLFILIYLFIIILVLLAMILFIPVIYSVEGAKEERYFLDIKISWLGNIINVNMNKEENKKIEFFISIFGLRIPLHDSEKVKKRSKKGEIKKQERKRKKTKKEFKKYFSFLQQSFLNKAFLLVKKVLKHILPKKYRLHLIYGFEDPADTGMLTGLFFVLFPNISNSDMIKIYPVFDEELIQGEMCIKGRIIIAVLIYYFLKFYFAQGVRQMIKKIRNK
ncbi:MAG: DUF2953 domain-containing protein [Candidatus Caldatribacteriota bacterium]|nr:DUF2953 domain-containing protein [Candidatus Caldatribacteriota bacterium]